MLLYCHCQWTLASMSSTITFQLCMYAKNSLSVSYSIMVQPKQNRKNIKLKLFSVYCILLGSITIISKYCIKLLSCWVIYILCYVLFIMLILSSQTFFHLINALIPWPMVWSFTFVTLHELRMFYIAYFHVLDSTS